MAEKENFCNPVLFEYRGFDVKKNNAIKLSLDEREFKKLIDAYHDAEGALSFSKIIALQGRPCQSCGADSTCIPIKKGLLSVAKQSSGNFQKPRHND